MSHGILQPLSHEELDFCGTAIAMHDEFEKTPDLVDMTMRSVMHIIHPVYNILLLFDTIDIKTLC